MKTKEPQLAKAKELLLCAIINGIAKHNTNVLKNEKKCGLSTK
jgi:hypothetical protein